MVALALFLAPRADAAVARSNGPFEATPQNGGNAASFTIAGVTADAGSVVLVSVLVTCNGPVATVSVSGGGLSWSNAIAPSTGDSSVYTAFFWAYTAGGISSQTITVTHDTGESDYWAWATAEAFSGVNTSAPVGATNVNNNAASSTASVTIDFTGTGRTGSYLALVGGDYNASPVLGSVDGSSTELVKDTTTVTGGWTQRETALVDAGSYTLSRDLGATHRWAASAVELVNGTVTVSATPTASPVAGVFSAAQDVTLSSATTGATICYTTDGSTPTADGAGTCTVGSTYSSAVHVGAGTSTIKAIASDPTATLTDSPVASFTYYVYPVQYVGSTGTLASGTSNVTCTMPTGGSAPAANDILLMAVESENQAIALTTANGFAEVPTCSPQSAGTAATNPGTRLALFWKRAAGSDSAPVVTDPGDHATCAIHVFRGAITSGDPWDVCAGGNDAAANDTTGTIPGATTTVANTTVVLITSTSYNATVTDDSECSGWTNAGLDGLAGKYARTNTAGLGGGHCMAVGFWPSIGDYGASTVTLAHTSYKGAISIALKGPATSGGEAASPAAVASQSATLSLSMGLSSSPASVASMSTTVRGAMGLSASPASVASLSPTLSPLFGVASSPAATGSWSSSLGLALGLSGGSGAVGSLGGALAGMSGQTASPAAVTSVSATLTLDAGPGPLDVAGNPVGQGALGSSLALALGLSSSPAAQASVASTGALRFSLSTSPAAQASTGGTYTGTLYLSASPAATGSLVDTGCVTSLGLSCSSAAQASASGGIAWRWPGASAPTGQGSLGVNMTVAQRPETTSPTAQASASAGLTFSMSASASPGGQASASATITTEGVATFLGSAPAAQASVAGTLIETFGVTGQPQGQANVSGTLEFGQPLGASPLGQGGAGGNLSLSLPFSGAMEAGGSVDTAGLAWEMRLSTDMGGVASVSAGSSATWVLSSGMTGQASMVAAANGQMVAAEMRGGSDLDATVSWGWNARGDIGGTSSLAAGLTLELEVGSTAGASGALVGRLSFSGQAVLIPALSLKLRLDSSIDRAFVWRMVSGDAETARLTVLSGGVARDCSSCTARLRVYKSGATVVDRTSTVATGGLLDLTILPGDAQPAGTYYASVTVDDDTWPGARVLQGTLDVRAAPTLPAPGAPVTPAASAALSLSIAADADLDAPFRWTLPAGSAQTARLAWTVGGVPQDIASMSATCGTDAFAEAGVQGADGAFRLTLRPTETATRGAWRMACRLTSPSWPGPRTILGTLQVR